MTVNKELFREIADAVEEEPAMYDQGAWGNFKCETPGCIAGWATHLMGTNPENVVDESVEKTALRYLFNIPPTDSFKQGYFPKLFASSWPIAWFEKVGIDTEPLRIIDDEIAPEAPHAAIICRAIADLSLIHISEPTRPY